MELFGERISSVQTDSEYNILQVESYEEIFFNILQLTINGSLHITEKVGEFKNHPIVMCDVSSDPNLTLLYPFIIKVGKKSEVYFNESNTELGELSVISENSDVIPQSSYSSEYEPDDSDEYESNENILRESDEIVDDVVEDDITLGVNEIIRNSIFRNKNAPEEMELFGESISSVQTHSEYNILQVEGCEEIFFDVLQLKINENLYIIEKSGEFQTHPVIVCNVSSDPDSKLLYPFIIKVGKKSEVYFNESNTELAGLVVESDNYESTPQNIEPDEDEDDDEIILRESDEIEEAVPDEEDITEQILESIQQAKKEAKLRVKDFVDGQIKRKQLILDKNNTLVKNTISEAKNELVVEFLNAAKQLKNEILEQGWENKQDALTHINETITKMARSFKRQLNENTTKASEYLERKLGEYILSIYNDDIIPRLENKITELEFEINEKVTQEELADQVSGVVSKAAKPIKRLRRQVSGAFEKITELKSEINEKVTQEELADQVSEAVTGVVSEVVSGVVSGVATRVAKPIKRLKKQVSDVSGKIAELKTEINEKVTHEELSEQLIEMVFETAKPIEKLRGEISDTLEKVTELESEVNEKATHEEVSKQLTEAVSSVISKTARPIKRLRRQVSDAFKTVNLANSEINLLIESLGKNITKSEDEIKELFNSEIDLLSESLGETIAKTDIDLREYVGSEIETLSESLESGITKSEENIKEYFDPQLKFLESKVFDLSEDTRSAIRELVAESRDALISEIRDVNNITPIEYIIENPTSRKIIKKDDLDKDIEKLISDKVFSHIASLKKSIAVYGGGGGTVAVQYANGGVMNGDLVINGSIRATQYIGVSGAAGGGSDVSGLSANWQNTYTTVQANSAAWGSGSDDTAVSTKVRASSANWDGVYSTVQANSAAWGSGSGSDVSGLSANWQNAYTTVTNLSGGWQTSYTIVQANSAAWNSGGSDGYKYSWSFLAATWSVQPYVTATLSAGDVYEYALSGVNRYRLVPTPYSALTDSFYSNFDGVNLTGLIISRG